MVLLVCVGRDYPTTRTLASNRAYVVDYLRVLGNNSPKAGAKPYSIRVLARKLFFERRERANGRERRGERRERARELRGERRGANGHGRGVRRARTGARR